MTQPSINITALKMNAPLGVAAELSLLVTVSSPQQDPASVKERPWLNLALAIDRSSSMGGRPLAEAKSCAVRVVRGLRPGDRVAIVAYDNEVIVPVPSVIVTEEGKAAIIAAIDSFRERGNTDLHSGWLEAATQAASGIAPNVLTRVLVLSDGQTNSGIKDVAEIARQAAALAEKGIATSTIGLGHNFNEDLMTQLADAGQGQSNYGETADDLWPSFEAEFGLLSATSGKNVRLRLVSSAGGSIAVENGYRRDAHGAWILPNLVHGAEVSTLVKLRVSDLAGERARLLEATVTHDTVEGVAAAPIEAAITQQLVSFADFVIGPSDAAVAEKVKEAEAAIIQQQSRAAANARDFPLVGQLADKLEALADGNAWLTAQAATMRQLAARGDAQLLSKEAVYATTKLRTSYTSVLGADAPEAEQFLKRRGRQGKGE